MEPQAELEELEETLEELDRDLEADPMEINRLKVHRQLLMAKSRGERISIDEAQARAFDEDSLLERGDKAQEEPMP